MEISFTTFSQVETEELGTRFSSVLVPGDVVAMFGDLGAGKTAFVRGVIRGFGLDTYVSSPTFSIVNEYSCPDCRVAHFDMYRIGSEEELYGTGFYDYLDGNSVIFIEWSENIPFAIDEEAIRVSIEKGEGDIRSIRIESPREIRF